MKLSDYFSYEELTASQYATRNGLDNTPQKAELANLQATAKKMDHVRRLLGRPIVVSSGYRSPEVNAGIGGSKTSDHVHGLALDFTCPSFGTPHDVFKKIKNSGVEFDQLIIEFDRWVHIGFGKAMRRECLSASLADGKVHYTEVE